MSNQTTYSAEDLFYAAGFLDGEGCFSVRNNRYHKVLVACENTYEPVIHWLHNTFGGNIRLNIRGKKANHRATHRWAIADAQAANFCALIAPYLREKTEQALVIIAIQQLKSGNGKKISTEVLDERNRLARISKASKGRIA
jgi:hypothetical protein